MKSISILLCGFALSASPVLAEQMTPSAEPVVVSQADSIDLTRPEISPPRRIPRVDLETGEVLPNDARMRVPGEHGMTEVSVGEYYDRLDAAEAKLNKIGYSMLNPDDDIGVISMVTVDEAILRRQMENTSKNLQPFDQDVMEEVAPTEKVLEDLKARGQERTSELLDDIWQKAAARGVNLPPINIEGMTPVTVPRPVEGLHDVLDKAWDIEHGEGDRFKIRAQAKLKLQGSLKEVSGLAAAEASVWAFSKEYSVASGYARAGAYYRDGFGGYASAEAKFFGNSLWSWTVNEEEKKTSARKALDDEPLVEPLKKAYPFRFMAGPIPISGEIGVQGEIDYTGAIGFDESTVSASLVPFVKTSAYANIAADAFVAKAGAQGTLTLLDARLTFEGRAGLERDPTLDRPLLRFNVKGHSDMSILSGRIFAFAEVVVPKAAPPFFRWKRWEHDLYKWDGLLSARESRKELFNFGKVITAEGYSLTGSPQAEDQAELDADRELRATFQQVVDSVGSQGQSDAEAVGQTAANALASATSDLEALIATFAPPQN